MPKHKSFSSIINTPDYVKCTSLNNQQCMARPTFIKQNRIFKLNKTEYLNLSVLNMIAGKKRVKNIKKTYIM